MLLQIIHQTPVWVFVLLATLLGLGLSQLRTRSVPLARVLGIAFGMCSFPLYGTVVAFGALPLALFGWLAGAMLVFIWLAGRPVPASMQRDSVRQRFEIPGSAWPLVLMMGIFGAKYGVAVATAMHPALAHDLRFAVPICLIYGACSGAFAGRAARLWRFARRAGAAAGNTAATATGAVA